MDSTQEGLRTGAIRKDTYERLICTTCDEPLDRRDDPDGIGTIRQCPECEREWRQLA